ncbi:hypothetical protein RSOLAG1IB_06992 [Rhizoctonia solani AG-1 IB]|uniref:Uncharacterized protein n=1 Tax=Thanatephorus cucumeris (strain AG1-IB / isolate 7/3/14) TaxID=1108050 RepID=A0A0B7FDP2_THACB|nr:hypothetical protein RSOLAG1IB_06992 [Rhizoctonia solani AG-1 IB]
MSSDLGNRSQTTNHVAPISHREDPRGRNIAGQWRLLLANHSQNVTISYGIKPANERVVQHQHSPTTLISYYSTTIMSAKPESVDCKGVKTAAATCSYPACDCESKK